MDRTEQIFALIKPLSQDRFTQSQELIEVYCENNGDGIAAEFISAFRNAFAQTADLQIYEEKGAVRYLVLSHLYSAVQAGGYSIRLDTFDQRFYSDLYEIDATLTLDWLYGFLAEDMACFRKELVRHIPHVKEYELEQIRYRYVYYYHALALKLISESIPALLRLPEFVKMTTESEFEVLFGGYMDKGVVIWPIKQIPSGTI